MNPVRLTVVACAAGMVFFAAGLIAMFPGEQAAADAARTVERSVGLPVMLAPLRVTWRGLAADRLEMRIPSGVLVLHDIYAPWSWRMLTGLPLTAEIGASGTADFHASWSGDVTMRLGAVMLQDLPLKLPEGVLLLGRIAGTAHLDGTHGGPPGGLPAGRIDVKAEAVEVRNVKLGGTALPPLRLETMEGRAILVPSGATDTLRVESLALRGDAEGTVTGTIEINPARPEDSRLNLSAALLVQRSWTEGLGDLRAVAESFLPGGRLNGTIQGTLGAPTFVPVPRR